MTDYRGKIARRLAPTPVLGGRRGAILGVVTATTSWGFVGLLVRLLDLPAVAIAGYRLGLAALAIGVFGLVRRGTVGRIPRGQERRFLVLGALMAFDWWLFIQAFQLTQIGVTVVLAFTWPVWVALLSRLLRLEAPDKAALGALAVSIAGIGLIATRSAAAPSGQDLLGMGAALLTSFVMSVVVLLSRSVDAEVSSTTVNFWQSAIAGVILAPFTVAGSLRGTLDLRAAGILLLLGVVLTGLGNTLFVRGMRVLAVPETAAMAYLEPVSATLLAAVFLAERPGIAGAVGMVMVLAAGLWVVRRGVQVEHVAAV